MIPSLIAKRITDTQRGHFHTKHTLRQCSHQGFVHVGGREGGGKKKQQNKKQQTEKKPEEVIAGAELLLQCLAAGYSHYTVCEERNQNRKRHGRDHTALMGLG